MRLGWGGGPALRTLPQGGLKDANEGVWGRCFKEAALRRLEGGWLKEVALRRLPYAGCFKEAALRSSDEAESSGEAQLFGNGRFADGISFPFQTF